jgi:nitrite reductase (NADH) large subunit
MGLTEPERDTDEHIVFSEPKRGVFKSIVIRDGKIVGATLLGNSKKLAFLQQAFDRGLPLPEERVELLSAWLSSPMTHRSATATASASP